MSKKVSELIKDLDISIQELKGYADKLGIAISSARSSIEDQAAERLTRSINMMRGTSSNASSNGNMPKIKAVPVVHKEGARPKPPAGKPVIPKKPAAPKKKEPAEEKAEPETAASDIPAAEKPAETAVPAEAAAAAEEKPAETVRAAAPEEAPAAEKACGPEKAPCPDHSAESVHRSLPGSPGQKVPWKDPAFASAEPGFSENQS